MSLRREILKEIKSMLNEVVDDIPDRSEQSQGKGPCVNPGDPGCEEYESTDYSPKSFEQTKAEFLDVTHGLPVVAKCPQNSQAYARIDVGQKLGIDPPNTPICFDGANNPIAVIGDPKKVTVKKKKVDLTKQIALAQQIENFLAQKILGGQPKKVRRVGDIQGYVNVLRGLYKDFPKKSGNLTSRLSMINQWIENNYNRVYQARDLIKSGIDKSTIQAESVTQESKNWLDRTRESTTSNLFERLVKDASKKKVI